MKDELRNHLLALWQETVHARYLFRGMSAKDLTDPLDPSFDPIAPVRAKLRQLLEVLGGLLASGFEFTVHEDYSGLSFDLRDIVAWTKGDLDHPGIDFTSSYESACGYAQNFQGSQVKQNFKYITDHLPGKADDALLKARLTQNDWRLVSDINAWASRESAEHKRVVLWVRRSCPAFESDTDEGLVLGSFEHFCARVFDRIDAQAAPRNIESVARVLPRESTEFIAKLTRPLYLRDIERIEQVAD